MIFEFPSRIPYKVGNEEVASPKRTRTTVQVETKKKETHNFFIGRDERSSYTNLIRKNT